MSQCRVLQKLKYPALTLSIIRFGVPSDDLLSRLRPWNEAAAAVALETEQLIHNVLSAFLSAAAAAAKLFNVIANKNSARKSR